MHRQAGKRSLFLTLDLPDTPKEACNSLRKQPDLSEPQTAEETATEPKETFFTIVLKKAGQEHSIPKCP